jgi:hypothetical protein
MDSDMYDTPRIKPRQLRPYDFYGHAQPPRKRGSKAPIRGATEIAGTIC